MTTIYASKTKNLLLGYVGENDCTQIVFDVIDAWLAEYPNAAIGLYNRPSHQTQSYPVASLHRSGTVAVWTVKSSDLTADGRGECQLVCLDNGIVKKSAYWDTTVMSALDGSGPPPKPWESWQQEFIDLKNDAAASASDAAASVTAAAGSASTASEKATAAAGSASDASASATAAAGSASDASGSATAAAGSASDAAASATAAAGSASDAAISATAAAGSASTASEKATAASNSATAAAASASDASASAALAQQYSYGVSISGTGLVFSSGIQE